jgi:hypothetical protein
MGEGHGKTYHGQWLQCPRSIVQGALCMHGLAFDMADNRTNMTFTA